MDSRRTHYQVLGVTPEASADQIRSAYRKQAKRYHPDRPQTGDHARFQQLQHAYEVLCDPGSRREYDQQLRGGSSRTPWIDPRSRSGSVHNWTAGVHGDEDLRAAGHRPRRAHDTSIDAVLRALFGGMPAGGPSARRRSEPFEDLSYSDEGTDAGRYAEFEAGGAVVDYDIYLSAAEAARGASATLATELGPSIDVTIPPGVYNGETLTVEYQLRGRRRRLSMLVHVRR